MIKNDSNVQKNEKSIKAPAVEMTAQMIRNAVRRKWSRRAARWSAYKAYNGESCGEFEQYDPRKDRD